MHHRRRRFGQSASRGLSAPLCAVPAPTLERVCGMPPLPKRCRPLERRVVRFQLTFRARCSKRRTLTVSGGFMADIKGLLRKTVARCERKPFPAHPQQEPFPLMCSLLKVSSKLTGQRACTEKKQSYHWIIFIDFFLIGHFYREICKSKELLLRIKQEYWL